MVRRTAIEWTDITDNIIVAEGGGHWCRRFDDGCTNCYAERLNQNPFFNGNKLAYLGQPPAMKLRVDLIEGWARQTKPKKHFVASMTDVCGEWVPQEWIFQYLDGMRAAPMQTMQVLTKRGTIMQQQFSAWMKARGLKKPPANIWAGVTLANQKAADRNLEAMARLADEGWLVWVSYEPALTAIDWSPFIFLRWLVSGGESGPKARPTHPEWHRSARDFCVANHIAYFLKQWGEYAPISQLASGDGPGCAAQYQGAKSLVLQLDGRVEFAFPTGAMTVLKIGKKEAGKNLDGQVWQQFPEEMNG